MKNPFSRLFKSRDRPEDKYVSSAMEFYFGNSNAGENVSVHRAMQLSAVYACVKIISETVASLPLSVYEYTDNGSKRADKHPLQRILHDYPNAEMTSFVWRESMMTHMLLWGNSYNQRVYNRRGQIVGLYPLLPDRMEVERDDKTNRLVYKYTNTEGRQIILSPDDVMHIPALGFDGIKGYSPIAMERNAIGYALAMDVYGSKFYQNGARPSGILTHPNTVKDPKKLRDAWNSAYGGSANNGKVAILEEGMTYHSISVPNNEAQFLETRKFQVDEICRIFGVPPHLIGDLEHATFSNIEHQNISFGQHTIRPWLVRIEQAMNKVLFTEAEQGKYFVQFNMDGLMRGDYASRMQGYATARQNGWMSANDIRALENLNPIPAEEGGDVYLFNGNMMPLASSLLKLQEQVMALQAAQAQLEAMEAAKKAEEDIDKGVQKLNEQIDESGGNQENPEKQENSGEQQENAKTPQKKQRTGTKKKAPGEGSDAQ